jgi:hypothetical protein
MSDSSNLSATRNAQREFSALRGIGRFLCGPELLMAAFVIRRRA